MFLCATIIFYTLHLQTTVTRIIKIVLETKREKKNFMNIFSSFLLLVSSRALRCESIYTRRPRYTLSSRTESSTRSFDSNRERNKKKKESEKERRRRRRGDSTRSKSKYTRTRDTAAAQQQQKKKVFFIFNIL